VGHEPTKQPVGILITHAEYRLHAARTQFAALQAFTFFSALPSQIGNEIGEFVPAHFDLANFDLGHFNF